jgi:hypothetical protein
MTLRDQTAADPRLWLAYYGDFSGLAIFTDEISALRYAVEKEMKVKPVVPGEDLREQAR